MAAQLEALFQNSRSVALLRGSKVFLIGDTVRNMYRIAEGQVDLIRHTADGRRMILHRARAGEVLAEASAYSRSYHCDAIVTEDTSLQSVPVDRFRAALVAEPHLAEAWAAGLARELQRARTNAEIRNMRTVSERLDAWESGGRVMPPKGQWQALAEEIGVSREALYRELAKRR